MDNIYKAVQLTIDSQNLALSKTPTHVYIANQYVDTNDTPLITAPFIIQKALENGTGVVDIVSSTIGSIYEVRLLCDAEVLISGYFYMPPMNVNFSELELYTSYPPRTPPVVNEFWQKTENFILEKTNTLLNFVQVFNAVSSMRLSLGYLEELLTTKKSNLVSAINEVYKKYEDVGSLYEKNVAAGAGANGWTTDLVGENGLTQKQINDGLSSVAAMLAIKNPRNGQRVYVKSYHAELNKGGGTFVYDSSKANINDNVSVINGWVRDLSSKILTTDDVGLKGDGTDTDATLRLQQLASAVQDGFDVKLIGKYTINRHIVFYQKKDIQVYGVNSGIQGDPNNWTWGIQHIIPTANEFPRGVLVAKECPNIVFDNLKIKGVNRNSTYGSTDQWQDGDCAIQGHHCHNAIIRNCELYNTWAWALSVENSLNVTAHNNTIYDVLHQSGINVVNNGDDTVVNVYNNNIKNCGLYGIEFETRTSATINCYGNNVSGCYAGTLILGDKVEGLFSGNNLSENFYSIYATNLYNENSSLNITNNHIKNSVYGINVGGANGIKALNNSIQGVFDKDTFVKITAEIFVAEIVTPNKILVHRSIVQEHGFKVGTEFYVNGTKFTVTATTPNTKAWAYGNTGADWFSELSIDKAMDGSYLFKPLHSLRTKGSLGYMGIQSLGGLKNNLFSRNYVDGFLYSFAKDQINPDPIYNELIENNTFINAQQTGILHLKYAPSIKYVNNTIPSDKTTVVEAMFEKGNVTLKDLLTVHFNKSQEFPNTNPDAVRFFSGTSINVRAISIIATSGTTTGNLIVTINGQSVTASSSGVQKIIGSNLAVYQGLNTIKVTDTVGDLVYSDVYVTLKTL